MEAEFKTPGIVAFLEILGWIMIALGLIVAALGIVAASSGMAIVAGGLVAAFGGSLLLAVCVVIRKLNLIEYHLRPKGQP